MLPNIVRPIQWLCLLAFAITALLATATAHAGGCNANGSLQLNTGRNVQQFRQAVVVAPYQQQQVVQQQFVAPVYAQPLVQQVYVPQQQIVVQRQIVGHHQAFRQNVVVQSQRQPRRSVQTQRIVTRNR
jgi:hypothetical protein